MYEIIKKTVFIPTIVSIIKIPTFLSVLHKMIPVCMEPLSILVNNAMIVAICMEVNGAMKDLNHANVMHASILPIAPTVLIV